MKRFVILSLRRISRQTNVSATIRDYLEIVHCVQDDTRGKFMQYLQPRGYYPS